MASLTPATRIVERLRANWTATPVFEAGRFEKLPQPPSAFVVIEFPGGFEEQETVGAPGSNVFREEGVFFLHVMVPSNRGDMTARGLCSQLAVIFRAQTFEGVVCYAPNPPQNSSRSDGTYFGLSFSVPYFYDLFA